MTNIIGTLTGPEEIDFLDVKRHEHHKITLSVSEFVSDCVIMIEEVVRNSDNAVNLDGLDRVFVIDGNGDTSFVLENQRIDKLRINFVSGDATIKCAYNGW